MVLLIKRNFCVHITSLCIMCSVAQSCLSLCSRTVACQASLAMKFSRQEYWSRLPFPSPGDLPNPGIEPGSPALQADSLPAEPPRKPKNTGVGSHSLLQGIFPTQGSHLDLLHCRQILYHLSHQESHITIKVMILKRYTIFINICLLIM